MRCVVFRSRLLSDPRAVADGNYTSRAEHTDAKKMRSFCGRSRGGHGERLAWGGGGGGRLAAEAMEGLVSDTARLLHAIERSDCPLLMRVSSAV